MDGGMPARAPADTIEAAGFTLEVLRAGSGKPILALHGVDTLRPGSPVADGLAAMGALIAPSHPGCGGSPRPEAFDTVYDLVHLYRAVIEGIGEPVAVVGFSFGAWVAAELAASATPLVERVVLVSPLGIKVGGREERDIAHFFNSFHKDLRAQAWSDPAALQPAAPGLGWQTAIDTLSDDDLVRLSRTWEALCVYGFRPHMTNPKLRHWLKRVAVPTLVVSGADDRILAPGYARAYTDLIPGARLATIPRAGHHPELEKPAEFLAAVRPFLEGR